MIPGSILSFFFATFTVIPFSFLHFVSCFCLLGALMGCITAIPADIRVHNKEVRSCFVDF
jgi:uncharacterized membrane protein